jgi:hypothetical protein
MSTQTNSDSGLESKLRKIEELQARYGIIGVRVMTCDGVTVTTKEMADSVISTIERANMLLSDIENIPLARKW